eukprot:1454079-Rhodomonas_salina.1
MVPRTVDSKGRQRAEGQGLRAEDRMAEGRGSRVEGRGSRVEPEGRGPTVEGRGSRVEGRGSRDEGRRSSRGLRGYSTQSKQRLELLQSGRVAGGKSQSQTKARAKEEGLWGRGGWLKMHGEWMRVNGPRVKGPRQGRGSRVVGRGSRVNLKGRGSHQMRRVKGRPGPTSRVKGRK